ATLTIEAPTPTSHSGDGGGCGWAPSPLASPLGSDVSGGGWGQQRSRPARGERLRPKPTTPASRHDSPRRRDLEDGAGEGEGTGFFLVGDTVASPSQPFPDGNFPWYQSEGVGGEGPRGPAARRRGSVRGGRSTPPPPSPASSWARRNDTSPRAS
ncbi:unnamed protein product, partial [Scytosiphon promiscuus]